MSEHIKDIEAMADELISTNIRPQMVRDLLIRSEPCLFSNKNMVVTSPQEVDCMHLYRTGQMLVWARWHAEIQIRFWKELNAA